MFYRNDALQESFSIKRYYNIGYLEQYVYECVYVYVCVICVFIKRRLIYVTGENR